MNYTYEQIWSELFSRYKDEVLKFIAELPIKRRTNGELLGLIEKRFPGDSKYINPKK